MSCETKADFSPEPVVECHGCEEPMLRSEVDDNGLCPNCRRDEDVDE